MKLNSYGDYHLFQTQHGNKILVLGKKLLAWIRTDDQGDMLITTDTDHKVTAELGKGKFFQIDFDEDEPFRAGPHLFLQVENGYREIVLPEGLPSENPKTVRIIATDNIVELTGVGEVLKKHRRPARTRRHRQAG